MLASVHGADVQFDVKHCGGKGFGSSGNAEEVGLTEAKAQRSRTEKDSNGSLVRSHVRLLVCSWPRDAEDKDQAVGKRNQFEANISELAARIKERQNNKRRLEAKWKMLDVKVRLLCEEVTPAWKDEGGKDCHSQEAGGASK